ncbi:lantibiotic dehydratase C-terminal domain-containing protein [Streptomyces sp. NPDC126497]|uniref:lantibiotic dehydratase C-terminal domain-containing protein n=1 Tax=Streptomyces sp. NPDC126497 TaxID=3155313 RepID=UPI00331CA0E9
MTSTPLPADGGTDEVLDVVAYYHQPVKARLLREAVLPLTAECRDRGLAAHVERHWLHGPHVRLRLRGAPARLGPAAGHAVQALHDWVGAHPSRCGLTDAELLEQAARNGRAELVAPPYDPIVPDNTVRLEPVDLAPLRRLLGDDGAALRDDLLSGGLEALRTGAGFLGEHGDGAQARVQLAVTALAAHAAAHPGGLAGGHWSYVSHLEDFLVHDDPHGRLREGFDRRWESAGDTVTALVGRIAGGAARGWERDWAHWSAVAWRLAQDRHDAGADLHGDPLQYRERAAATGDAETTERWSRDLRTRYSEFHRLLRRSDPEGTMWSRPDYLIYRACTNALYRLLAICDVTPLERYLAAHLVIRAVPRLTGCDWRAEMAAAVDARERGA